MDLFHHITVFSLTEDEKRLFVEAGINFTVLKTMPEGESVTFDIGECDPRYGKVTGLLKALGKERFRDFSMTVPTLQEFIKKVVRPGAERLKREGHFASQAKWEHGREVMRDSLELLKKGQKEEALRLLDAAITEAIRNNHNSWIRTLCQYAAAIALSMRDRQRQIHYEEQALPFVEDWRFAAYNFAQLLLKRWASHAC